MQNKKQNIMAGIATTAIIASSQAALAVDALPVPMQEPSPMPVPEPATYMLLVGGMVAAIAARKLSKK